MVTFTLPWYAMRSDRITSEWVEKTSIVYTSLETFQLYKNKQSLETIQLSHHLKPFNLQPVYGVRELCDFTSAVHGH